MSKSIVRGPKRTVFSLFNSFSIFFNTHRSSNGESLVIIFIEPFKKLACDMPPQGLVSIIFDIFNTFIAGLALSAAMDFFIFKALLPTLDPTPKKTTCQFLILPP